MWTVCIEKFKTQINQWEYDWLAYINYNKAIGYGGGTFGPLIKQSNKIIVQEVNLLR